MLIQTEGRHCGVCVEVAAAIAAVLPAIRILIRK